MEFFLFNFPDLRAGVDPAHALHRTGRSGASCRFNNSSLQRRAHGLGSVADLELGEDADGVTADRNFAVSENAANLANREILGNPPVIEMSPPGLRLRIRNRLKGLYLV